MAESTGFDSGLQVFAFNLYPPCLQPDLALGMPPHTDHGLLTFLYEHGIGGLQVKHDGRWVNVDPLEAVRNGKCKSILHRAVLNNKDTRISIAAVNGPELDKEIWPAAELVEKEGALFKNIMYKDYFQVQHHIRFAEKSLSEEIRLDPQN